MKYFLMVFVALSLLGCKDDEAEICSATGRTSIVLGGRFNTPVYEYKCEKTNKVIYKSIKSESVLRFLEKGEINE